MNLAAILAGWLSNHRIRALDDASAKLKAAFDAFAGSQRSNREPDQVTLIAIATVTDKTTS